MNLPWSASRSENGSRVTSRPCASEIRSYSLRLFGTLAALEGAPAVLAAEPRRFPVREQADWPILESPVKKIEISLTVRETGTRFRPPRNGKRQTKRRSRSVLEN